MIVEIEGLDALIKKLGSADFTRLAKPTLDRAGMMIEADAKRLAPVDMGRLRSSITHETEEVSGKGAQLSVGSNVFYAPYQEYGTGLLAEGEGGSGERHWPPGDALGTWAERHGFANGFVVAAAIGKRGGLRPKGFMRAAFAQFKPRLGEMVDAIKRAIEAEIGK